MQTICRAGFCTIYNRNFLNTFRYRQSYDGGQQIRDWLYVEDHCSGIRRVLEAGTLGETYNIGGWNEKANIDIVQTVWALLDEWPRPRRAMCLTKSRVSQCNVTPS